MQLHKLTVLLLLITPLLTIGFMGMIAEAAPVLQIKITLDNTVYNVGSAVNVNANITLDGSPAANVAAIEIVTPLGIPFVIRTVATGNVSGMYARLQYLALYTCGATGAPKSLFAQGETAYINVTIKNIDVVAHTALVGLYVQGSDNTVLYAYFPTYDSFDPGQTITYFLSFPIPTNAPFGQARIFGSLFTDYPSNRGYAYCPEQTANFSVQTSTPLQPQQPQYSNLTFTIPKKDVKLGNYTVYAATNYNVIQTATDTQQFTVVLLGDIVKDYVINMRDISQCILHFQTTPQSGNWNPDCDINKDLIVNMRDVALLILWFGNSGIP